MRLDHKLILGLINENATVLDLGCGDGTLLKLLEHKNIHGQGIEINSDLVKKCLNKGMPVLQDDIDQGFSGYKSGSFDFVILNKTLQATHKPLLVMQEALRVGTKVLVSFPNFGYLVVRSQLFFGGKMPKSHDLPFEWYNTPNIHLVTIKDFRLFCKNNNFKILQSLFYNENTVLPSLGANLFSPYALFVLSN